MNTIIRYANQRFQAEIEGLAYRIYVTDCLRMISRNTAHREGDNYLDIRFSDIIRKKPQKESGAEIAARVIAAVTGEAVSI